MTQSGPEKAPPDVPRLLHVLARQQVRFVVVGSVAAQLHGVEAQPGDFDITPALDRNNPRQQARHERPKFAALLGVALA